MNAVEEWQIVIDVSFDNINKGTDLSKVVAFRSACKSRVIYMTELTKAQAERLFTTQCSSSRATPLALLAVVLMQKW